MENKTKTDDEIWDDLLSSSEGLQALDYLLNNLDIEEKQNKVSDFDIEKDIKIKIK